MKLTDAAIAHPVVVAMVWIAVSFFGTVALFQLRQDFTADVQLPSIIVVTRYPGAGPEEIESEISDIIERELASLSGITRMKSDSGDSLSVISLEFDYSINLDLKMSDIRERLSIASAELPRGISGPPSIMKMSSDLFPIYSFVVSSEMEDAELGLFVRDRLAPALSRISGVSQANVRGDREEIVEILLDSGLLDAKEVSVSEVLQVLELYNLNLPGGAVRYRNSKLMLKTSAVFRSLDDIRSTVIAHRGESLIRLRDVADVRFTFRKAERHIIEEGKEIVVIDILKQHGADSMAIIEEVEALLKSLGSQGGDLVTYRRIHDFSEDIDLAISSVRSAAFGGAVLAVLVLLLFLRRLRTTLIIALSIPASLMLSFAALYLKGQSLNLMTLGALTLSIGMIVDSSIVVLENTHRRFEEGCDRKQAARLGAGDVGSAVLASTSTSLMVFVPLLFLEGFTGIVLRDVAWTLTWALSASLLSALVLIPWMASLLMDPLASSRRPAILAFLSSFLERAYRCLLRCYKHSLLRVLRTPYALILFALLLLIASIMAIDFLGFRFIPSTDMKEIQILLECPPGYSLEDTRAKVAELDQRIAERTPEIESLVWYVGNEDAWGRFVRRNRAFARMKLLPLDQRKRRVHAVIRDLQRNLPSLVPDVNLTLVNGGLDAMLAAATGGEGFRIELTAASNEELDEAASRLQSMLEQDPDVLKTGNDMDFRGQEIVNELHLDLTGSLGVSPREAALSTRVLFHGMEVGSYTGGEEQIDLFLSSNLAHTELREDLFHRIYITTADGQSVPFSAFSRMRENAALSTIRHSDRMRSANVIAYLGGASVRDVSARIRSRLEQDPLPPGVSWSISGAAQQMGDSFRDLVVVVCIAVFLVYTVMVIQFERFVQPLIVMAAVPFVLIGVVISLAAYGSTLNIVSFMGIIALAGVVVNNAIVLIDYINSLRRERGLPLSAAVVAGAEGRFRPILMTSLTTVIGILPMAAGIGEGAEIYAPLGQAISGGLVTSTLVTLYLVPVLYLLVEARVRRLQRWLDEEE